MSLDAVVLAGRVNEGRLKGASAEEWEALIDIAGEPMLQYVIDALEGASSVSGIVVVGPGDVLGKRIRSSRTRYVQQGGGMLDNLSRGFEALPGRDKALVCTCDIPLITPQVVDGFISECSVEDADFYYPIVSQEVAEERFPGVKRTYAATADGTFTGGNMFVARLGSAGKLRNTLEFLVENRKKPLRMAAVLGVSFTIKLLFKRLTVREAEDKVLKLYGIRAKAVFTAFPEIGIDVDKPSDLELARSMLGGRG
ncbi:MAG: NTP transferase domain-containing protein [Firmicutes bacterium]|nr:NTP transferase domain-containing protein [Bacillota bacterium]